MRPMCFPPAHRRATLAAFPATASRAVLATLALCIFASGCGRKGASPAPVPEPEPVVSATPAPTRPSVVSVRAAASIADSVFLLTNRERARANLTPLRRNAQLTRAAQLQAEQMATAQKLAHDLPGARYPSLVARLKFVGYLWRASGENVAEGYTSGAALLAGWMTSAPHRANILSAKYTETGIGTARAKSGRTYHAQLFGRPR